MAEFSAVGSLAISRSMETCLLSYASSRFSRSPGHGWHNGNVMASRFRGLGKRLARVDLRKHEDEILLLLALVVSAVVGLIVVAFVAVTERMGDPNSVD